MKITYYILNPETGQLEDEEGKPSIHDDDGEPVVFDSIEDADMYLIIKGIEGNAIEQGMYRMMQKVKRHESELPSKPWWKFWE